jgi:acetyl-CoA carboxylase biotin carboxylase subunit
MFRKIVIANRGEIAVRIVRACRELGIASVVAHSECDRDSLGVLLADEAICIGPAAARDSYLNIANIVSAADVTGADAIHPGYGFLSENPFLAQACADRGVGFIGPSALAIARFADKVRARNLMDEAGIRIVPGVRESLGSVEAALAAADEVGFPVMLKAAAGGGGRGMRVARGADELARNFPIAQAEAQQAFGNASLYIERLIERGRHIEFQVAVDCFGTAIHLGERECSLQRRHQKVVEESPSLALSREMRDELGRKAAAALAANGYTTLGTVEFIMDQAGQVYFLEVNTRLQVEHPVTELVTGIDLVKLQIALAAGESLPHAQADVRWAGHAIEARVTAEDPSRGFAPAAGTITQARFPGGPWVRTDTHVAAHTMIQPYYDSLLAKIIVWGNDRAEAVGRMQRALFETQVDGIATNLPYLRTLVADPRYIAAEVDVEFIGRHLVQLAGAA